MTYSILRIVFASLTYLLFPISFSFSQGLPPKDAAYFCTDEFGGGLAYNKFAKKWESTKFRPEKKFVLKLSYKNTYKKKRYDGKEDTVKDFDATITDAGGNDATKCFGDNADSSVPVYDNKKIFCSFLYRYVFNLETNRFIRAYLIGYIDPTDEGDDTPAVMGGTCTRIQ